MVIIVCLGLTALLQADEIAGLGDRLPAGPFRSLAQTLAQPLQKAAAYVGLNRPAQAVAGIRACTVPTTGSAGGTTTLTGAQPPVTLGQAPSTATAATTPSTPSTTTLAVTTTEPIPVYSTSRPLRIWVGGDSMVEQVGDSLINMATSLSYLDARMTFKINSGLCRPDYFNWPQVMEEAAADFAPQVAVLMFGGNDMQGIVEDGEALTAFSPRWTEAYAGRVAAAIETFTSRGIMVIWLGAPIMRDGRDDTWSRDLDAIYAEVSSRYPRIVHYVDCRALFAGPDGGYAAYLKDDQGKTWQVREPDGIHFTLAGGDWVATEILRVVRAEFVIEN